MDLIIAPYDSACTSFPLIPQLLLKLNSRRRPYELVNAAFRALNPAPIRPKSGKQKAEKSPTGLPEASRNLMTAFEAQVPASGARKADQDELGLEVLGRDHCGSLPLPPHPLLSLAGDSGLVLVVGLENDLGYRLVISPSPTRKPARIHHGHESIIVAFLTAFEVSAETDAGTEAEACQSGSYPATPGLIVLEETEAPLDTAKTLKPLETKKLQKRKKKLEKLQNFLAESKMQVRELPKGSESHPTGALLLLPFFSAGIFWPKRPQP